MKKFRIEKTTIVYVAIATIFFVGSLGSLVWRSAMATEGESYSALDAQIVALDAATKTHPTEIANHIALANAYVQKVREDGDVTHYDTIAGLLEKVAVLDPENADVSAISAVIANGRHNPALAYALIQKSIAKNKEVASFYGVKADAEIELGKYEDAIESLQTMIEKKPNYSVYTRIAYIRELHGDVIGAEESLRLAISAGSNFKENISWAYVELGKLHMRTDVDQAELDFMQSLAIVPDYPPALEGLGRVAFARGEIKKAKDFFTQALAELPLATYAIDLGDVYASLGDLQKAKQQYTLAELALKKSKASGVNTDLEYALFLSDHGDPALAVLLATESYKVRPTIYGADALAWALYKTGAYEESAYFAALALRLGEHDPQIVFHAAMINEANGEMERAQMLYRKVGALNPHFSILYAKVLEEKIQ